MNKANGFASIYRELKEYPSEAVTEVIESLRLKNKAFTAAQVRDALERRVVVAARYAWEPEYKQAPNDPSEAVAEVIEGLFQSSARKGCNGDSATNIIPSREGDLNAIKERIARKCQRCKDRVVSKREWNAIVYKIKEWYRTPVPKRLRWWE